MGAPESAQEVTSRVRGLQGNFWNAVRRERIPDSTTEQVKMGTTPHPIPFLGRGREGEEMEGRPRAGLFFRAR